MIAALPPELRRASDGARIEYPEFRAFTGGVSVQFPARSSGRITVESGFALRVPAPAGAPGVWGVRFALWLTRPGLRAFARAHGATPETTGALAVSLAMQFANLLREAARIHDAAAWVRAQRRARRVRWPGPDFSRHAFGVTPLHVAMWSARPRRRVMLGSIADPVVACWVIRADDASRVVRTVGTLLDNPNAATQCQRALAVCFPPDLLQLAARAHLPRGRHLRERPLKRLLPAAFALASWLVTTAKRDGDLDDAIDAVLERDPDRTRQAYRRRWLDAARAESWDLARIVLLVDRALDGAWAVAGLQRPCDFTTPGDALIAHYYGRERDDYEAAARRVLADGTLREADRLAFAWAQLLSVPGAWARDWLLHRLPARPAAWVPRATTSRTKRTR